MEFEDSPNKRQIFYDLGKAASPENRYEIPDHQLEVIEYWEDNFPEEMELAKRVFDGL